MEWRMVVILYMALYMVMASEVVQISVRHLYDHIYMEYVAIYV